jgi:hypothetical protein
LPENCCNKKCYNLISIDDQMHEFNKFWSIADYNLQNYLLNGLMSREKYFWKYSINNFGTKIIVCKNYLLKLFQISSKRIENLHKKIIKGL